MSSGPLFCPQGLYCHVSSRHQIWCAYLHSPPHTNNNMDRHYKHPTSLPTAWCMSYTFCHVSMPPCSLSGSLLVTLVLLRTQRRLGLCTLPNMSEVAIAFGCIRLLALTLGWLSGYPCPAHFVPTATHPVGTGVTYLASGHVVGIHLIATRTISSTRRTSLTPYSYVLINVGVVDQPI